MAFLCAVSPVSCFSTAAGVESASVLEHETYRVKQELCAAAEQRGLSRVYVQPGAALATDRWLPVCEMARGGFQLTACFCGSV